MRRYDETTFDAHLKRIAQRRRRQSMDLYPAVSEIITAVIDGGDQALKTYSQRFDGIVPDALQVPLSQLKWAYETSEMAFQQALTLAIENITTFHTPQLLSD